MSGRVTWYRDGQKVTGYRKTDRRNRRTPPHLLPDWVLTFELPGLIAATLLPGSIPMIGVRIGPLPGHVTIAAKSKPWILDTAEELLRKVAPHGLVRPLNVHLTRAAEAGPTISGPLRRAVDQVHQIAFDGRKLTIIGGAGALRSERRA